MTLAASRPYRRPRPPTPPPWTDADRALFRTLREVDQLSVGEAAERLGRTVQDCATEFSLGRRGEARA